MFPNKVHIDEKFFLYYYVPDHFILDLKLILDGKYSQISSKAKKLIKTNSGLMYKTKSKNGDTYTSKLILALDKSKVLIKYLFDALKTGSNSEEDKELYNALASSELVDKISDDDFL